MNVRPLQNRVIIKRREPAEKTPGGLHIPEIAREQPVQGEVVAVSKPRVLENGTVVEREFKVGDKVVFDRVTGDYASYHVVIDGEKYMAIDEDDVCGVIET